MHPALSIVFFTTASGAGFALLLLLGLGAPLGLLPRERRFRFCRPRSGGAARCRRACLFGVSPRPAGAGLARLFAMAVVVAVARGRLFGPDFPAGGDIRHRLGILRRQAGADRSMRHPRGSARGGDDLLHRHDLRIAKADPSMAQPLGRAELLCAWADERLPRSRFSRPPMVEHARRF